VLPGSPAIDQGLPAGVTSDLDSQPRLGADELPGPHLFLPVFIRNF
jgi:hypothetical protein